MNASDNSEKVTLPPLDTPEFWNAIEPITALQSGIALETLAKIVRQFALQGEIEKARRVFGTIYKLYEESALKLVKKYCYSPRGVFQSAGSKSPQLVEELAQEVWTVVYEKLTNSDSGYIPAYLDNFTYKFTGDVRYIARQQGVEEGYRDESRIPSNLQTSLETPVSTGNSKDEAEELTVSGTVADELSSFQYEMVEILDALKTRLNLEEQQIIKLLMNDKSKNEIAKRLHIAEKTLNRKLEEIRKVVKELLSPDP